MSAEIPDGAVIVARAILNSSLWTMRPEDCKVALTCIAVANHKAMKWWDGDREILIERGQFVRSWDKLAEASHLSVKTVRTSVQNLENSGFLARLRAKRYSIYTIPKYQHYQDLTKYSDSVIQKAGKTSGSDRAGNGQQTIIKELNKGGKEPLSNTKELTSKHPAPPLSASPGDVLRKDSEHHELVKSYLKRNPRVISPEKALVHIETAARRGVTTKTMAAAFNSDKADNKKIWDILDGLPVNGHITGPVCSSDDQRARASRIVTAEECLKRRAEAKKKLKECDPELLAEWKKDLEKEIETLKLPGPGKKLFVEQGILLKVAQKYGIAKNLSEL